ncbi:MAG: hypothetical protein KJ739_00740 [Nitrospinae bacterium]|nr:hypothetical protein [Nitrospinota bacterium]
MERQIDIKSIELWLGTDSGISSNDAEKIRGYIGRKFIDDSFLHHHTENNKLIYRYPIVQYKIIDGNPLLIGIKGGVDSLWKVFDNMSELNLDNITHEIFDKKSLLKQVHIGVLDGQSTYSFLTPWLALNEKNYEKYQKLGGWHKRKELLEKILIGNIISMSKSLGYTVPEPIHADISTMKEVQTTLKATPMLGFLGMFSVNFEIPDYWGIGKSVSRGFGTVKRCSLS